MQEPVTHPAQCSSLNAFRAFPMDMANRQCLGLNVTTAGSRSECEHACCVQTHCSVWQWCPKERGHIISSRKTHCSNWLAGRCYTGRPNACTQPAVGVASRGWISRSRTACPAPPCGQQYGWLPRVQVPKLLGHHPTPAKRASAVVTAGERSRLDPFLRRLASGHSVSVAVVGGSISAGSTYSILRGRQAASLWHGHVFQWLNSSFPQVEHRLFNGALPASTPAYVESCLSFHVPEAADLVFVEYAVNFDNSVEYERLLRRSARITSKNHIRNECCVVSAWCVVRGER